MARPTREDIYNAVFALGSGISWKNAAGATVTPAVSARRALDLNSIQKPAFCQVEPREQFEQVTRMPSKRTFKLEWWFFFDDGLDQGVTPITAANNILDAVESVINTPVMPQDLRGLVHHVWIEGTVMKVSGDIDGLGVVIIPISVLVP